MSTRANGTRPEGFSRRSDEVFERRFGRPPQRGGKRGPHRVTPLSTRRWLAKLVGITPSAVDQWRRGDDHVPSHAWALLRLLEERQELRDRLAAALRETRELRRGLQVASRLIARQSADIKRLTARPLYAPRTTELDRIQEEEWRRTGVVQ